jgi:hypothetical protein
MLSYFFWQDNPVKEYLTAAEINQLRNESMSCMKTLVTVVQNGVVLCPVSAKWRWQVDHIYSYKLWLITVTVL